MGRKSNEDAAKGFRPADEDEAKDALEDGAAGPRLLSGSLLSHARSWLGIGSTRSSAQPPHVLQHEQEASA